jgi:hypothetical protein
MTNAYSMVTNITRPNTVTWTCCTHRVTMNMSINPVVSCQPTVRWLPMLPQFDLQTKYQLTPHFLVGHVACGSDGVRLNEHETRSIAIVVGGGGTQFLCGWACMAARCHGVVCVRQRGTNRSGQCSNERFGKGGITYHAACMRGHP